VAQSLVPGTHASTFGGNPLVCAAAIATIQAIEEENLLENARNMGEYAQNKIRQLQSKYSCIDHVRGVGLMIGIQLAEPGAEIVKKCWAMGMRINCTHDSVLRFMPAMNVTENLINQAVDILGNAMAELYGGNIS
jgi:acetylornithine/succinyldiaminopimelate/putrescine aminotransferase